MKFRKAICVFVLVVIFSDSYSQLSISPKEIPAISDKELNSIISHTSASSKKIQVTTQKYLDQYRSGEQNIYKKLKNLDPQKAELYLMDLKEKYADLDKLINSVELLETF